MKGGEESRNGDLVLETGFLEIYSIRFNISYYILNQNWHYKLS